MTIGFPMIKLLVKNGAPKCQTISDISYVASFVIRTVKRQLIFIPSETHNGPAAIFFNIIENVHAEIGQ